MWQESWADGGNQPEVGPKMDTEDILQGLSEVQQQAVLHREGPMVIFAGAGSGKTRIITTRLVYLMRHGVPPRRLLAVTFTNKAAREMRERVQEMSAEAEYVQMSTFHALCARWLRSYGDRLGYGSDFAILDSADCLKLMKDILKGFPETVSRELGRPQSYLAAIEKAKRRLWLPNQLSADTAATEGLFPPYGIEIYKQYQQSMASANAMDFGDLIANMVLLLRTDMQVKQELQSRYRYIMVDEYQDTNQVQFELIQHLAEAHHNLVVVGDDDQSIYSWRGAVPENIIRFDQHYPEAKQVRLEHNYRCSGNIIAAARAVIQKNKHRADKKIWTTNAAGDPVDVVCCVDGRDEADQIVGMVREEKQRYTYPQVAIFYRTNAQSRVLEEVFKRYRIPYRIYGGMRFYDRAEIKDILAYLRLALNERDNIAFQRIVNVPTRGIGNAAQALIQEAAQREQISYLAAARLSTHVKVQKFVMIVDQLKHALVTEPLGDLVSLVMSCVDYQAYLKKKFPEQLEDKLDNVMELGTALEDYENLTAQPSLRDWLEEAALAGSENEAEGGISLMTMHLAKGLEFDRVYVAGVEETLLPHQNSMGDLAELEEERRLFYVGMTRAKQKLSLFYAQQRNFYTEQRVMKPSRFLREIPQSVVRDSGMIGSEVESSGFGGSSSPCLSFAVGDRVSHPAFGSGRVVKIEQERNKTKLFIDFADFGLRKLDGRYLKKNS
ncbi:MAG: UvrD-helicase domain-containing protein [Zetaproteobacteria bacterium]|nr:UvrD-helicase domain-containing protein [Zetaproteobacteria bacterium]